MTVKEIIKILSTYDQNTWVDCNDDNGIYTDIIDIKPQEWKDEEGHNHKVITILHKGYDSKNSKID